MLSYSIDISASITAITNMAALTKTITKEIIENIGNVITTSGGRGERKNK